MAAGAEVHPLAEAGIAHVGQVVGLGAGGQGGVLDLDEVADVHARPQAGAAAQPRIGADDRARPDAGAEGFAVDVGVRADGGAGRDAGVAQHAVGTNAHAVAELDPAFEDAAGVDLHVAAADELAAHVEASRVGQAHAGLHVHVCRCQLVAPLEVGQLHRAVDAEHLGLAAGGDAAHRNAVGDRQADDVGQVVLAGGVVVGEAPQPGQQALGRRGQHPGVDLADGALRRGGVFLLHDGDDAVACRARAGAAAHDAAVALRLGEVDREQAEGTGLGRLDQGLQAGGADQRHVAVEHQGAAARRQQRRGLLHGMAGAQLRLLAREAGAARRHRGLHFGGAMAGDHRDLRCPQAAYGIEDMLQ